jgi:hypothetical protein
MGKARWSLDSRRRCSAAAGEIVGLEGVVSEGPLPEIKAVIGGFSIFQVALQAVVAFIAFTAALRVL